MKRGKSMETGKEVVKININNIIPNRFQPRISFDEQGLEELSNSIKMYGILQPLILRPLGDKYEIIAGERRYKAATMAGLADVPAILVNLDDQTSAELAIIENIQRKDLTAIEEAKSYKKLIDLGNYTQDQLAIKMGKKQSTIANKLRLLNLIPQAQEALMNNLISERHARSLLQLKEEPNKQQEILNRIINERLTVRDTDNAIKLLMGGNTMNQNYPTPQQNIEQQSNNNFDLYNNQQQGINIPNMNVNNNINEFSNEQNYQNFNTENNNIASDNGIINNNYQANTQTNMPNNDNNIVSNENNQTNNAIPNLNNDTFNLSQLSDPNLNIPTTPTSNTTNIPSFDFNNINNNQNTNIEENKKTEPDFDSLLQVEEEEKPIEKPVEETPIPQFAPSSPAKDVYYPPLDKEPAVMDFANPYEMNTENNNSIVNNDINKIEESTTNNITNNNNVNNIATNNSINFVTNQIKETVKKIQDTGSIISTEEADLGDTYQIIIKIKKEITPTM